MKFYQVHKRCRTKDSHSGSEFRSFSIFEFEKCLNQTKKKYFAIEAKTRSIRLESELREKRLKANLPLSRCHFNIHLKLWNFQREIEG